MSSNLINEISMKVLEFENCNTHGEIIAYFRLIRRYGLIESKYLENIDGLYKAKQHLFFNGYIPICSIIVWNAYQIRFALFVSWISSIYILYAYRKQNKIIREEINNLSSIYKQRIDNYKKSRDLRDLNPKFLEEKIENYEIKLIQFTYNL